MGRSWHSVTEYLSPQWRKKKHMQPLFCELFKKPDHGNSSLFEFELAKAHIESKDPIIVRLFILQEAPD